MEKPTVSGFQQRVYDAVCLIPCGRVASYRAVAAAVGCGSSQAVGQALRRNPFAPVVPCHRVIAADGSLGGFAGARSGTELKRKRRLLRQEGVLFGATGRLVDATRFWDFGVRG